MSIVSVFLLYRIGETAINKKFGYLLSFVGAISFSEIANSVNLLNTALVSFAVSLSLFAIQRLLDSKKLLYGLLLGFGVGLAINAHLQALSLLSLIPLSIIFIKCKSVEKIKIGLSELLGLLISFIPLIIFEVQHSFAWSKSVIDYSLHVGEKFYVPIRWLTELTQFWPDVFGKVIFGVGGFGIMVIVLMAFALLISIIKKKLPPKLILISLITFIFEIISVRYYKGPRSSEYFIVVQPFIILFLSWSIWQIFSLQKIIGIITLVLLSFLILKNDLTLIKSQSHAPELITLFNYTKGKYKDIQFYSFANSSEINNTFFYLLQRNKLTGNLINLGICDNHEITGTEERCPKDNRIQQSGRFILYILPGENKMTPAVGFEEIKASILWNNIFINYQI
jgi:hypothetical protein